MKADLKLKSEWVDDYTIAVSWVDVIIKERKGNFIKDTIFVIASLGFFLFALFAIISEVNFLPLIVWLLFFVAYVFLGARRSTVSNIVEIGKTETRHDGHIFPTARITRFEIGSESALLGEVTTKPLIGERGKNQEAEQTLIRMWVDDVTAYDLSKNSWQTPVNHRVRDALAKALEAVRDLDKQQEHEAEFGKVADDTGMPDY